MPEELKDGLAAPGTEGAVVAPVKTDETHGEETSKSTFDTEALSRRIEEVSSTAATRAELESLRRQAGHVPALQSEIAALKEAYAKNADYAVRVDALEQMLLDALPADQAGKITEQRAQRAQESSTDARFSELETRILDRLDTVAPKRTEEELKDPRVAAYEAAANAASQQIHAYATELGVDPTEIPAGVYEQAQRGAGGDLVKATEEVIAWIDERATAADAEARRTTRAGDASGGNPAVRAGATGQYDLSTVSGLSAARHDEAITSEQFIEGWRKLRGGI